MKTQTIAGHQITLEAGVRYYASRPMAQAGYTIYPVRIWTMTSASPVVVVDGLTYDQANAFLDEFNDGPTSFQGRVW